MNALPNVFAPVAAPTPAAPVESKPSPRTPSSHAFASLLKQSQGARPTNAPAKTDPVKPSRGEAAIDDEAGATSTTRTSPGASAATADARRADDAKAGARRAGSQGADGDEGAPAGDATGAGDDADRSSTKTDASGAGIPFTHGLVALQRPVAATTESVEAGADKLTARGAATDAGERAGADAAGTADAAGGIVAPRERPVDGGKEDARTPSRFAAELGVRIAVATDDTSPAGRTTPFAPAALRSDAATPAPSASLDLAPSSASGPVDVAVATPVASPDFAQAFAVQVSVLARDGVQSAELHLNPVETGPVSVRIVVEGNQARIDFGADALATRQAIEAGLPELAGALREAGMTLQGGGVSQHARDPNADAGSRDGGSPSRSLRRDDDTRAAPVVRQRTVAAGGVDLYA